MCLLRSFRAAFIIAIFCVSLFVAVGAAYGRGDKDDSDGCCCDCCSGALAYVGRDYATKGNWTERGYGDCGYALPYAEPNEKEVAVGETAAVNLTDMETEFWWRTP